MGASIFCYWPEITEDELENQPGFSNDCKAWGGFMADVHQDDDALAELDELGVGALLTFRTEGVEDDEVEWVAPEELESAALALRKKILAGASSVRAVLRVYAQNANDEDPIHEEMARDLADIAAIAQWAAEQGVTEVTLDVNW